MSFVQDSRSIRRMATCSPVGRYRARFTVIRSSKPRPRTHTSIRKSTSVWTKPKPPRRKSRDNEKVRVQLRTDHREEMVGAAVGEVAAHGVPSGERAQTLLAVFMGLRGGGEHRGEVLSVQPCGTA